MDLLYADKLFSRVINLCRYPSQDNIQSSRDPIDFFPVGIVSISVQRLTIGKRCVDGTSFLMASSCELEKDKGPRLSCGKVDCYIMLEVVDMSIESISRTFSLEGDFDRPFSFFHFRALRFL